MVVFVLRDITMWRKKVEARPQGNPFPSQVKRPKGHRSQEACDLEGSGSRKVISWLGSLPVKFFSLII